MHARARSQHAPDPLRGPLQLLPAWAVGVVRAERQAEAVTLEAGDDVQVDVEDVLSGSLPVCEEEVDPLAPEPATVERGGYLLGRAEQSGAGVFGQPRQGRGVIVGHDEDVARVDGLDVHKRRAAALAHYDARGQPAREYFTEDAILHARHYGTTSRGPAAPALAPVSAAVTFGYVCYYLIGFKALRVRRTSGG